MSAAHQPPTDTSLVSDSTPSGVATDANALVRLGWVLVLFVFGGLMLWAGLAPLDQGVPVAGVVTVSGHSKAVQHESGGTVESIFVKDGDFVKLGQPLVRLNNVQARANAETTRIQYFNAMATEARLIAERDQRSALQFPPTIMDAVSANPSVAEAIAVQKQLFSSRQASLAADISALEQNVAGLQAFATGLENADESKRRQLQLLQQQIEGLRGLAKEGYMPRNRLLELERQQAQLEAALAEDSGSIGRTRKQVNELHLQMQQTRQNRQKELRADLVRSQNDVQTLRKRLEEADFHLNQVEVKAPAAGTVTDLAVFTEGGVVPPGFRMMVIVPHDQPLVIEAQVPVHLIDLVRVGMPVDMNFTAFNQRTTPQIDGIVTEVSADRTLEERSGAPFFKVMAKATPEGVAKMTDLQVRAGMPVSLLIRSGERTLANYLLRPLLDRFRTGLTEE